MKNSDIIFDPNKHQLTVEGQHGRVISIDERPLTVPFLKWAGGKQWLAPIARYLTPPSFTGCYYEPFIGGGSIFFSIAPQKAVLSDLNEELICTYEAIKTDVDRVIEVLLKYPHNKDFYYKIRKSNPRTIHTKAARFIYLNRTCWNGLYRVNLKGEFNVPFGAIPNPTICNIERLKKASQALNNTTLSYGDFEESLKLADKGDFVYLDPPYISTHKNNGFLKYNSKLFSWDDQERLSELAHRLSQKGVYIVVSNANHESIFELYNDFYASFIHRQSLISGNKKYRGKIAEVIFSNFRLFGTPAEIEIKC